MAISTYLANALLDMALRGVSMVAPDQIYVSLHTADPRDTGENEITGAEWPAYVRQVAASDGGALITGFDPASAGAIQNAQRVLYAALDGASQITVSHFGLWDAETGGNYFLGGALTTARNLLPDDEAVFYPSSLTVTAD